MIMNQKNMSLSISSFIYWILLSKHSYRLLEMNIVLFIVDAHKNRENMEKTTRKQKLGNTHQQNQFTNVLLVIFQTLIFLFTSSKMHVDYLPFTIAPLLIHTIRNETVVNNLHWMFEYNFYTLFNTSQSPGGYSMTHTWILIKPKILNRYTSKILISSFHKHTLTEFFL